MDFFIGIAFGMIVGILLTCAGLCIWARLPE